MPASRHRPQPLRTAALLLIAAAALLTVACASQQLRPGTGDVSFRLRWQGDADLDLHVMDPLARHTGVSLFITGAPEAQLEAARADLAARIAAEQGGATTAGQVPAGVLDIDCNASPHQICPQPIENVFWPTGTAPNGRYEFWVHLFQPLLDVSEVPFTVEIRRGEQVVKVIEGSVTNERRASARFTHEY